jgi:hypothetical protein
MLPAWDSVKDPAVSSRVCVRSIEQLVEVVLLLELFYTAAAIDELLLTREERMALCADVETNLVLGGLRHERVAAGAGYLAVLISGMDTFLHRFAPPYYQNIYCTALMKSAETLYKPYYDSTGKKGLQVLFSGVLRKSLARGRRRGIG